MLGITDTLIMLKVKIFNLEARIKKLEEKCKCPEPEEIEVGGTDD